QPAGMPVLQVHALRERPSERPYFYMCSKNPYAAWFHIDPFSGILYMNKTLEWTDFDTKFHLAPEPWGCGRKRVALTFVNATAPSCGQLQLEKLCFPDRDINPHIKENCMPGPLRQLRRFTYAFLCPNYTISYRVKSELVVVAPVDREEKEAYPVIIVCMVQVEKTLHTLFTPLHITVYDEDDNPPYVNGTDTVDVLIEFSRSEVGDPTATLLLLFVFVGTLMTNDSWIKDMFTIQHTFREEKAIFDNVRGTVHEYKLSLSTNVSVEDKRSFQLAYLVNDTTYPGTEGTVMLHFNVTVLPVTIHFSNITYFFVLSRKATAYSQVHMGHIFSISVISPLKPCKKWVVGIVLLCEC
uniref:Cadherin domain-containing protein n=1 Tax=Electrophorus electricus TaxID=8005 RepID=A0A4W4GE93_ELEEL